MAVHSTQYLADSCELPDRISQQTSAWPTPFHHTPQAATEASLFPGITLRRETYIFSFPHLLQAVYSESLGMEGHAGDGNGAPGGSRADHLGPRKSAVDSASSSPPGARAAQRLAEMLAEHRAADVARAGAVGRDSARTMKERWAKADAKEARYKAAVANDRKVAAAAKAFAKTASKATSKAASKADVKQEEDPQAEASGNCAPAHVGRGGGGCCRR